MGKWVQNVCIETAYTNEGNFVSGTKTQTVDLLIEGGKVSKIQEHQQINDHHEKVDGKKY